VSHSTEGSDKIIPPVSLVAAVHSDIEAVAVLGNRKGVTFLACSCFFCVVPLQHQLLLMAASPCMMMSTIAYDGGSRVMYCSVAVPVTSRTVSACDLCFPICNVTYYFL
jgi:hypothetical protein